MTNSNPVPSPQAQVRIRKLAFTVLLAVVAVFSVLPVLDQRAADNYESLFQRAIVTFALARTLNGVISAAQGTEVALQPAGVGVTLTPGQILDPVNDLVERFSWIMLGATISLGIQNVLLDVSAWWVLQGLVVMLALALIVVHWLPAGTASGSSTEPPVKSRSLLTSLLWRGLFVAMFLRFAVPLTLVANEAVYELFLESRFEVSTEVIQAAGQDLERLSEAQAQAVEEAAEDDPQGGVLDGVLDALGAAWEGASSVTGLADRVDAIQARAASVIEHLIQLSVVFILQTGILPLAFLWLFLQLARWLLRPVSFKAK